MRQSPSPSLPLYAIFLTSIVRRIPSNCTCSNAQRVRRGLRCTGIFARIATPWLPKATSIADATVTMMIWNFATIAWHVSRGLRPICATLNNKAQSSRYADALRPPDGASSLWVSGVYSMLAAPQEIVSALDDRWHLSKRVACLEVLLFRHFGRADQSLLARRSSSTNILRISRRDSARKITVLSAICGEYGRRFARLAPEY